MASHKTLKSVVTSLAQSFASLMNYRENDYVMGHIVAAAWASGATGFRVNLLSGVGDPSPLLVAPVQDSVAGYVARLPDMVARSGSSMDFIAEAELSVSVDPSIRRPVRYARLMESPFTCAVRVVDDRGRLYFHEIRGWWFPERHVIVGSRTPGVIGRLLRLLAATATVTALLVGIPALAFVFDERGVPGRFTIGGMIGAVGLGLLAFSGTLGALRNGRWSEVDPISQIIGVGLTVGAIAFAATANAHYLVAAWATSVGALLLLKLVGRMAPRT